MRLLSQQQNIGLAIRQLATVKGSLMSRMIQSKKSDRWTYRRDGGATRGQASHRDGSETRRDVYCRIAIGQYFASDELCLMGSCYAKFQCLTCSRLVKNNRLSMQRNQKRCISCRRMLTRRYIIRRKGYYSPVSHMRKASPAFFLKP